MAVSLLSPEQLAGVYEKLKRAEESIGDLNSKIVAFLKERPEGGFSDDKQKAGKELVEFHAKRVIPLRFAVLTGEIIDHLGSSLEYIAWMLSADAYRRDHPTHIGFPIKEAKPTTKNELASYDRQVKGIKDACAFGALDLIEQLQPYNAPNPADDPLTILHELHRENKHHTLPLIVAPWQMEINIQLSNVSPLTILDSVLNKQMEKEGWVSLPLAPKAKFELSPYIAFAQIGRWKGEAVIPALTHLLNTVRDDVRMFSELTI